jgi:hypothetical protein
MNVEVSYQNITDVDMPACAVRDAFDSKNRRHWGRPPARVDVTDSPDKLDPDICMKHLLAELHRTGQSGCVEMSGSNAELTFKCLPAGCCQMHRVYVPSGQTHFGTFHSR